MTTTTKEKTTTKATKSTTTKKTTVLKPLNNLGDLFRKTPGMEKMVAKVDKYNYNKKKKSSNNSKNRTQESLHRETKTN